jgi:hypothetical protein
MEGLLAGRIRVEGIAHAALIEDAMVSAMRAAVFIFSLQM